MSQHPDRLPPIVAAFGFAGLIPPVAAAVGLFLLPPGSPRDFAWVGLVFYAALIFSFLGGTWWAFTAARPGAGRLLLAVGPSLLALVILLLLVSPLSRPYAAALLAAAIALSPLADKALDAEGLTPGWWMRLRVPLSIGLASCVVVAAWRVPIG